MDAILHTWRNAPLLLVVCPFVLGMIVSSNWPIALTFGLISLMISQLMKQRRVMVLLLVIFYYMGITLMHFRIQRDLPNLSTMDTSHHSLLIVSIDQKLKSTTVVARSTSNELLYHCSFRPRNKNISPGDTLYLTKPVKHVTNRSNPSEFNFEQWLYIQGIHSSLNLQPQDFELKKSRHSSLAKIAFDCRVYLAKLIDVIIPVDTYSSMAKGILLGIKGGLSDDHATLFKESGVMHVMAVSGLHVGLVAYLLLIPTTFPVFRSQKLLRFLFVIFGIWSFVMITGMRPSGVRAALMFTIFFIGQMISKKPSALNSLGLAVFVMLSIDPFQIWDIGFQLSISAVLSIILFFPVLEHLIKTQNPYINKLLQLLLLSLSVQFLLAPVSIYHFHQFPVNFLLSNLIAIPMATLVLSGTIISVLIYHLSIDLALGIGQIVFGLMHFGTICLSKLNDYLGWILTNLWPDTWCVILYYFSVLAIYFGFIRHKQVLKVLGHLSLLCLFAYNAFLGSRLRNFEGVIAYGYPHLGVIDYCEKGRVTTVGQSRSHQIPALRSQILGPNGNHIELDNKHVKLSAHNLGELFINPLDPSVRPNDTDGIYFFNDPAVLSVALEAIPPSSTIITSFYLTDNTRSQLLESMASKCIDWWDCQRNGYWMRSEFKQ